MKDCSKSATCEIVLAANAQLITYFWKKLPMQMYKLQIVFDETLGRVDIHVKLK